jgi:hypothetical protein
MNGKILMLDPLYQFEKPFKRRGRGERKNKYGT